MKRVQNLAIAIAAVGATTVAFGPAEALVRESWDPSLIAYSYVYYADAAKTEVLGYAWDTCGEGGGNVYVLKPYIPTPYYDETPAFVCSGMGPYLPPDWPY
ncbi:hypothetical protein [Brevundimonas sp.]|jgi:hypothetical protein|uniref:hypothetical protein n=1 Tax=Brevundimonas sp. TaxID=1871086 RepID=UPI001A2D0012|nr:hypothetical protein [Brevundimonas sp.]MBJ7511140.1 hypothetical protein [Brevundimonas sp.]